MIDKDGVKVRVIAGEYGGVYGPVAEIAAQPLYLDVTLGPLKDTQIQVLKGHTAIAYVFEGSGTFTAQGEIIEAVKMLVFDDGDLIDFQASVDGVRFMLMMGKPFEEPIVPYGPFVMNSQEEIQQAFVELRNGTFIQEN
jgi:redox-sensitive bicupin YhaK (pirin superfamily)